MLVKYRKEITKGRAEAVLVIKGQVPLFNDVKDYYHSGHAAAISEYRKEKRDLAAKRQNGLLVFIHFLEFDEELEDYQYTVVFKATKNAVWNEENAANIDSVTIVPPANGVDFTQLEQVDEFSHYAPTNDRYRAKVYDIRDSDEQGFVEVSTICTGPLSKMLLLTRLSTYHLIPKPPRIQKIVLTGHLGAWS
ncbi:unnamed protein product [Orchesella dallaii]|uniref:Uncharacterized protein n=1 Tax=Orchesella dallaii TaxID=48710 RepID=A0ABP1PXQ5_9HEXA